MNRSLEAHDHRDSAECAGIRTTLLDLLDQNELIVALRHCLTLVEQVMRHHTTFCIELRYVVGIANELAMDSDSAEACYKEMTERGDYTLGIRARYMAYRYELLTARVSSCAPEAQEYFNTRALAASDEVALVRRLGAVALR